VRRGQHYACRPPGCRLPVQPKKMLAGLGSRLGQCDGSYFWIMPGPTPREHDKSNERGTQDERVDQEPQDDRVRAHLHAAHNGEAHRGAEEDAVATDVRTDRDGPERELVPPGSSSSRICRNGGKRLWSWWNWATPVRCHVSQARKGSSGNGTACRRPRWSRSSARPAM
jgi:hypothetical protein